MLEEIKEARGRNTELISLYLPPDRNLQKEINGIRNEQSEADNIQSKSTRKNVKSGLSKIEKELKKYKEIPENGLVVFAGKVDDDMEVYVYDDLPSEIDSYVYKCDKKFHTEPLEMMVAQNVEYGLIAIDRKNCKIGFIKGSSVVEKHSIESQVPSKHKAGGQSQQRFERLIEEALEEFFKEVGEKANSTFFDKRHELKGVIVGGPMPTRDKFIKKDLLHHELDIVGKVRLSNIKDRGLEEMLERSKDILEENEQREKKEKIESFLQKLGKESEAVTYGIENSVKALKRGGVDEILVIKGTNLEGYDIEEIASNYSTEVTWIEDSFEEAVRLNNLGGIGAILRYPMHDL